VGSPLISTYDCNDNNIFAPAHEVLLGSNVLVPDGKLQDAAAVDVLLGPAHVKALPPLWVDRSRDRLGAVLLPTKHQLAVGVAALARVHRRQISAGARFTNV
jgi:hypothetical protein